MVPALTRRQTRRVHTSKRRSFHQTKSGRALAQSGQSGFFTSWVTKLSTFLVLVLLLLGVVINGGLYLLRQGMARQTEPSTIILAGTELDHSQEGVVVLLLDPPQKRAVVVQVAPDQPVELLQGFGEYDVRAVTTFLLGEKKSLSFVKSVFSYHFERVVNQIWLLPVVPRIENRSQLLTLLQHQTAKFGDQGVSPWQAWQWWAWLADLRPDQISFYQVSTIEDWRQLQKDQLSNPHSDDCSIAIVNTTGVSGLATKTASIIEQTGFSVVRVIDEAQALEHTQVRLASAEAEAACGSALKQLPNVFLTTEPAKIDPDSISRFRADMTVLIGQDLAELFK